MAKKPVKYRCNGLIQSKSFGWNDMFVIGNDYIEAKKDSDGKNLCDNSQLLLYCRGNKHPMYVDKNQFDKLFRIN